MRDRPDHAVIRHRIGVFMGIGHAGVEDEIIVALGASIGGHPNHRIGNRYEDLKEMGHDVDNPAGV